MKLKHDMDATRRFEKGGHNALWNDADILTLIVVAEG